MSRDVRAESRFDPTDDGSEPSLTDDSGRIDEAAVKGLALPVLEGWQRERSLAAVRARLQRVFLAAIAIVLLGSFVDADGLTGILLQAWYYVSLPVGAVAGAMLATVRDPTAAKDVWWDSGLFATLGLLAIATLVRVGDRNPYARAAFQLLTTDDSPFGDEYGFTDDGVDSRAVATIRRYVRLAVAGSLVVAAVEFVLGVYGADLLGFFAVLLTDADDVGGGGGGTPGPPSIPISVPTDPLSVAVLLAVTVVVGVLLAVTVVVGVLLGFLVAVRREL